MDSLKHICLLKLEDCNEQHLFFDGSFYKIMLVNGVNGHAPALMFFNPDQRIANDFSGNRNGFVCLFSRSFFTNAINDKLNILPVYSNPEKPCILSQEEDRQVSGIFMKMFHALQSDYLYKEDLLRNYVSEMLHIALKSSGIRSIQNTVSLK